MIRQPRRTSRSLASSLSVLRTLQSPWISGHEDSGLKLSVSNSNESWRRRWPHHWLRIQVLQKRLQVRSPEECFSICKLKADRKWFFWGKRNHCQLLLGGSASCRPANKSRIEEYRIGVSKLSADLIKSMFLRGNWVNYRNNNKEKHNEVIQSCSDDCKSYQYDR